jgi:hypothetical protein
MTNISPYKTNNLLATVTTDSTLTGLGTIESPLSVVRNLTLNAQTDSYALVLADANKLITITSGGATTLTVPLNANQTFPIGTVIAVASLGIGTVTVAGDGVVSVLSNGGLLAINGQYAVVALFKIATDTWLLAGNLA